MSGDVAQWSRAPGLISLVPNKPNQTTKLAWNSKRGPGDGMWPGWHHPHGLDPVPSPPGTLPSSGTSALQTSGADGSTRVCLHLFGPIKPGPRAVGAGVAGGGRERPDQWDQATSWCHAQALPRLWDGVPHPALRLTACGEPYLLQVKARSPGHTCHETNRVLGPSPQAPRRIPKLINIKVLPLQTPYSQTTPRPSCGDVTCFAWRPSPKASLHQPCQ